ncbi:uncharacterized protein LOC124181288 isoform X1 [Neodiprion fabricii]|uniref:uncharacterized protein LOC124181288 isoform X1 n=1 Tax=Neodiprion fabricii TaxID=2872261 RepID=UPI001ED942A0|nr:uncharacterized protein LOC124181288 isoform X1 [Neodiprion fabricii]
MNKNARLIFRLCVTVGNLRNSASSAARALYTQNSSLCLASDLKDRRYTLPVIKSEDNDVILQALSMARTKAELLEIIKTYSSSLKFEHSLKAFKIFDTIHRQNAMVDTSLIPKMDIHELCKVLSNDVKSLSGDDAVLVLRVLRYFNVPSSSFISQSLTEHIKKFLHTISFQRLIEFDTQLGNFESSPLSEALKIAVPIILETRLKNKMLNTNDMQDLTVALNFMHKNSITDRKIMQFIIDSICKQGQNMTVSQATEIFKTLSNLKYLPHNYQEVVQNVQQVFTDNMKQLSYFKIVNILNRMYKAIVIRPNMKFYNEELLDACGNAAIAGNMEFSKGVKILNQLCYLGHMHVPLMDYLIAEYFQNPGVLLKCSKKIVMCFVISLASFNYKPMFWKSMQPTILEIVHKDQVESTKLLEFAVNLAVFDCFEPNMIDKLFSENFLKSELSRNKYRTHWNVLLLYQSVQTLCLIPVKKSPPRRILEDAIKANEATNKNSSLLPALEKAMGGSQYVICNLKTKLGHYIDHIVIMRKGGYAVALNLPPEETNECKPITYIEELPLPSESQVVIVKALPARAYTNNSQCLKGSWTLLLRTLEKQTGHAVISINLAIWNDLKEHEKIPHLMQAIRLKCDYLSEAANVS